MGKMSDLLMVAWLRLYKVSGTFSMDFGTEFDFICNRNALIFLEYQFITIEFNSDFTQTGEFLNMLI